MVVECRYRTRWTSGREEDDPMLEIIILGWSRPFLVFWLCTEMRGSLKSVD